MCYCFVSDFLICFQLLLLRCLCVFPVLVSGYECLCTCVFVLSYVVRLFVSELSGRLSLFVFHCLVRVFEFVRYVSVCAGQGVGGSDPFARKTENNTKQQAIMY